jgi:uncharacterized protein (DUF2267 family)
MKKVKKFLKRKKIDYDMPIGRLVRVPNFLPPPDQLIFPDEPRKVTINLSRESIEFFKRVAKKQGVKYQKLIRAVIDAYVARHQASH